MVTFKAVGVLSEPSPELGKFIVVVAFKQVTQDEKGLTETELSQQRFTVASAADLAAQCQAVIEGLKEKHEHAERTIEIVGKVIAEVTATALPAVKDGKL